VDHFGGGGSIAAKLPRELVKSLVIDDGELMQGDWSSYDGSGGGERPNLNRDERVAARDGWNWV
jgi:hypothetical protein